MLDWRINIVGDANGEAKCMANASAKRKLEDKIANPQLSLLLDPYGGV